MPDAISFGRLYEGCPESIQPFWISREPVAWPWCNFAVSQRRPYCASVNSHSTVGLVSRQWEDFDWACVLCDRRVHKSPLFQRRFWLWENVTLHVHTCLGRNRIIPLMRQLNTDSTPKKPVTLQRNQLLIRYAVTSPVHTVTIRCYDTP